MQILERLEKSKISLIGLSVAALLITSLDANADILPKNLAPHLSQHEARVNQELAQQREFVAAALEQSQAVLASLLEQSHSAAATYFGFDPATREPAAERLADFSAQQADIIADYALGMRLRNAQIAGDFSDHINTRAVLFFETGSLFGAPDLELEVPDVAPPLAPPEITVPFPGLTAPVGGFFATLDNNP